MREIGKNETFTVSASTTGSGGTYGNYCFNRLPCGICKATMNPCPVFNGCGAGTNDYKWVPTWDTTEVPTINSTEDER